MNRPLPSRLVRSLVLAGAGAVAVAACGGGSGGTAKADYAEFCLIAADLDAQTRTAGDLSSGTISSPTEMKKALVTLGELSEKLLDAAPAPARDSLEVLVEVVRKRNALFAQYNYSIQEMAAVPEVRTELESITSGKDVADASDEFASFMEEACNFSRS